MLPTEVLQKKTKRKLLVQTYGRRSRPRARSVDTEPNDLNDPLYTTARSTESVQPNPSVDEDDQLTPLLNNRLVPPNKITRSYSLDSDPHYQFVLYGTSCSFLTSGFSVSVTSSKQGSIVTIFAIWNTIIGSSLLAMPWSVQEAGLGVSFILMFFVASLAVYTAYRLLKVQLQHGQDDVGDVPYLCKKLLGTWAEITSRVSSFVTIFGANVVYWILMSNCLYHSVGFLVDTLFYIDMNKEGINDTVLCIQESSINITASESELTLFQKIWNLEKTVPIFLIFIVLPLVNFKSATFFTKFNSIGTLSVIYLFIFVMMKSFSWGINVDFTNTNSEHFVSLYQPTFFASSGMLPLSLFIHNIVITLMRNNRHQEHNSRDLSIAYILVVLTYLLIGFTFYICFPLPKSCIQDNMLNNFPEWDGLTVLARVFLFLQLLTVYPLLSYMFRLQIFSALNYPSYPSAVHVAVLNSFNILGCVLFAVFLPRIGTIIRFTGAICGFVYVFTIPCLLYLYSQKQKGTLTVPSVIIHTVIPIIGFLNLAAQFFFSD